MADLVHHVTRFRIHLKMRAVAVAGGRTNGRSRLRWCSPAECRALALPAPYRKLLQDFLAGE